MRRLLILFAVSLPLFATQPDVPQRERELIDRLFAAMDLDRSMKIGADAMLEQLGNQIAAQRAGDESETKELVEEMRAAAAKIDFGGLMRDAFVVIYAKYFTEEELADLVAFYSTPTGRKMVEVQGDLTREGMSAGVAIAGPKVEAAMKEATEAHERKKRPWRRTMEDMRAVADALYVYRLENERFPAGDYASLKEALVPHPLRELPETDAWGQPYVYVVSEDRNHYRLISAGADGKADDDLIYEDGELVKK